MNEGQELKCERAAGSVGLTHPRRNEVDEDVLLSRFIWGAYLRVVSGGCSGGGGGARMGLFALFFFLREGE